MMLSATVLLTLLVADKASAKPHLAAAVSAPTSSSATPSRTVASSYTSAAPTGSPTVLQPYAGETTSDVFPPNSTTVNTAIFPNESQIGFAGPTPTGAEAFAIETAPAYAYHNSFEPLVEPAPADQAPASGAGDRGGFNILRLLGNLTPWFSVNFGLNQTSPLLPSGCSITQVHLVHRHGARYPTSGAAPAQFAAKLHAAAANGTVSATGALAFLNTWEYKLGGEILTPYGRKQMFDLGISFRNNYGALLNNFTAAGKLPTFRSETQDRMVKSALNFAAGFFGIPYEGQYNQELIIEANKYNNTFAPYDICTNSNTALGGQGSVLAKQWWNIYLAGALQRLSPLIPGFNLTISDLNTMQQLCAYETVALGFSPFCHLFTQDEWEGFEYAFDISFWYNNAFGSPVAAAQGAAYANELYDRLTNVLATNTSFGANTTLTGNPTTFPLGNSIYVDATHEVVVLNILTALNFTSLARTGPLPTTYIPPNRSFIASQTAPFGVNLVAQVLDCAGRGPQIRFLLNDGALPIGITGCPADKDGLCPLPTFLTGLKARLNSINWAHDCLGNYTFSPNITDGRAPLY